MLIMGKSKPFLVVVDYLIHTFVMMIHHFHIIMYGSVCSYYIGLIASNSCKWIHSFVYIVMCLCCDQNICYS